MIKEFESRYCPDPDTEINLQDSSSPILKKISKLPKHSHKEKKEKKHSKKKDRLERHISSNDPPKQSSIDSVRPPKPETMAITMSTVQEEEEVEGSSEEESMPRMSNNNGDINFDIPLIITEHSCFGNKDHGPQTLSDLIYKVEFKTEGGKKKNPTFYTFSVLKQKCPELLLDYLQKSVKF
jgi:hypothetical protein